MIKNIIILLKESVKNFLYLLFYIKMNQIHFLNNFIKLNKAIMAKEKLGIMAQTLLK